MKMKDVCVKTGLTERAVRFYADKDLIHPKKTKVNGRENWEFDEKDIEELLFIAKLRKAEFSVQDIKEMRENADNIPGLLSKHYEMVIERHESDKELIRELMNLQNSANQDWKTIGKRLFQSKSNEGHSFAQYDEPIEEGFVKKYVLSIFKKLKKKAKENWEASTETQNVLRVVASVVIVVGAIGSSFLDYLSGNRFLSICFWIVILLRLVIKLVGDDRG